MGELAILHADDGRDCALQLAAKLAREGHSVLRRGASDGRGLAAAGAVIVLWSKIALSPPLLAAARAALARRAIVPARIGGAEPPPAFSHVWPIDLDGWNGEEDDPRWQFVRDEIALAFRRSELPPPIAAASEPRRAKARAFVPPSPPRLVVPVRMIAPAAALASVLASAAILTTTQSSGVNAAEQSPAPRIAAAPPRAGSVLSLQALTVAPPPDRLDPQPVAAAAPAAEREAGERAATAPTAAAVLASLPSRVVEDVPAGEAREAAAPAPPVPPADDFKGPVFRDCVSCPDMTEIPPLADKAAAFALSRREITFDEWNACVADGGCRAYRPSDSGWGRGRRPAINVSFEDASAYAAWLSAKTGRLYRLPSAAEWRHAATPDGQAGGANLAGAPWGSPLPVASFGSSALGLYDMRGNVWEWTSDCWQSSQEGDCAARIAIGGAFDAAASAEPQARPAKARRKDTGFRVARDL